MVTPATLFSKVALVIVTILFEGIIIQEGSILFLGLGHGRIADTHYRQKERVAVWIDYLQHPSPATKAKFEHEMSLMHRHEDWKPILSIVLFFAINGIGFYYYFKSRGFNAITRKPPVITA